MRFHHADKRETSLVNRRLVHMANPHWAAIQWTLTPENWSGRIEIRSALDGAVSNQGVPRYRDLNSQHLEVLETGCIGEDGIYLSVQTSQSHIRMVQAARTRVFLNDEPASLKRQTREAGGVAEQRLVVECYREKPLRIDKVVAI